jgi:uncharacterized protein (UPF0332 family)
LKHDNAKWATIQAYYAMFHTARALPVEKPRKRLKGVSYEYVQSGYPRDHAAL